MVSNWMEIANVVAVRQKTCGTEVRKSQAGDRGRYGRISVVRSIGVV